MNDEFYKDLPQAIQDAIKSFDYNAKVQIIGGDLDLTLDQISDLEILTKQIMVGTIKTDDFIKAVSTTLEIDKKKSSRIATEISEKILKPIKDHLVGSIDFTEAKETGEKEGARPTDVPRPFPNPTQSVDKYGVIKTYSATPVNTSVTKPPLAAMIPSVVSMPKFTPEQEKQAQITQAMQSMAATSQAKVYDPQTGAFITPAGASPAPTAPAPSAVAPAPSILDQKLAGTVTTPTVTDVAKPAEAKSSSLDPYRESVE